MAIEEQEQFCIHHMDFCKCPMENYTIVYRFSTAELIELKERFERICQEKKQSQEIEQKESMDGANNQHQF